MNGNGKYQLTQEGLNKLKDELDYKKNIERHEVIESLKEARAQGDLSENADYDAARTKQAHLEARIKDIEQILKNYEIINHENNSNNLGKVVTIVFTDDNSEVTFRIVGSLEADPSEGKISDESPLGSAILNRKVGESAFVKPEDAEEFIVTIKEIND